MPDKKMYHEVITDAWNILKQGLVESPDFDKIVRDTKEVYDKHTGTAVDGFTNRLMMVILEEVNRIDQGETE